MNTQLHGKARKRQKQEDAIERQAVRESKTPEQQLEFLDSRFGKGIGSKKERRKLIEMIEKQSKEHKKKKRK
jgi:hypothetical protein